MLQNLISYHFLPLLLLLSFCCFNYPSSSFASLKMLSADCSWCKQTIFASKSNEINISAWCAAIWLFDFLTHPQFDTIEYAHSHENEPLQRLKQLHNAIIEHRIEMIGQSIWLAVISNGTKSFCRRRLNDFILKLTFRQSAILRQEKRSVLSLRIRFSHSYIGREKKEVERQRCVHFLLCKQNPKCHPFAKFN